jgi:hypothetical protein
MFFPDDHPSDPLFLGTPLTYDYTGFYATNSLATVCPFGLRLSSSSSVGDTSTRLQMDAAMVTVEATVSTPASAGTGSQAQVTQVSADVLACRTHPFCMMCTVSCNSSGADVPVVLFHEVAADTKHLVQPIFDLSCIFVNGQTVCMLVGSARSNGLLRPSRASSQQQDRDVRVAWAFAYIADEETETRVQHTGFNVYAAERNRAYSRLEMTGPTPLCKVHILACVASSLDFDEPEVHVRRMLLAMLQRPAGGASSSAARIRSDHVFAWHVLWHSGGALTFLPPQSESPELLQQAEETCDRINRVVRQAQYHILSSVRESQAHEIDPINMTLLDTSGQLFWDADAWMVPLLLLIQPRIARSLLELRFNDLRTAMRTAASLGYNGALYPYRSQAAVDRTTALWDVTTPLTLFHSAHVGINAWNYFRVSRDTDWLTRVGFPILREISDFYVSRLTVRSDTGEPTFDGVMSPGTSTPTDRNLVTHFFVRLLLKYAIEACHQLGTAVPQAWSESFFALQIPMQHSEEHGKLLIPWDGHDVHAAAASSSLLILDPFLVLVPWYQDSMYDFDVTAELERDNYEAYRDAAVQQYADHPINRLLTASLEMGLARRFGGGYADSAEQSLLQLVDDMQATGSGWGQLNAEGLASSFDISVSALLLLVLFHSLVGIRQRGGVAETAFYYEELRIEVPVTSVYPRDVMGVRVQLPNGLNTIVYNTL